MTDSLKSEDPNLDCIRDTVFNSIFKSIIFSEHWLFQYLLRAGSAKIIIISESLNIIARSFDIPLNDSIVLDKSCLLKIDKNKSLQEYASSYYSPEPVRNQVDCIDSDRTLVFNKLSEIMFGGSRAEAAYIDSKESFDQIVYTIVRNRDYKLVREIYFQAIESEDSLGGFSRQFSAGPEKNTLGVVGPISLNKAHPDIFNRIRNAEVGQLIKPFYVEGWWICIRVENRQESSFTPEIESVISHQMLDNWLDRLSDDILNKAVDLYLSR